MKKKKKRGIAKNIQVARGVLWVPTGDTLNKAYLEEWLSAGGDSSEEQTHWTEKQDNRKEMGLKGTIYRWHGAQALT